jgi:hypothetical protein
VKDLFKRITIDIVDKLIDKSSITHHDARQTTRQNTRAGKALVPLTRATNELGDEAAQRRSFVQRIAKLLLLAPLTGARSLANSAEFSQADRASGSATQQEPRFALLICCERYPQNKNLLPAHKTGRDLQRSLQRHGFTVDVEFDTDRSAFLAAINRFRQLLHQVAEDQPKIALIYFFGHGMQQDGINYLLPAGVATDDPQAKEKSVNLQKELLTAFPQRYPGLGVAIIDACRNGDGQEDKAGGFNYFTAPTGCLVAFSASAGQVALSPRDYGRNSFYTAELVQSLDNIKDELPITDLDGAAFVEDDLVTGQAAPDQDLQIQLRPYGGPPLTVKAHADDQGRFRHDFHGQVDLAYNDAVGLYLDLGGHGLRRTLSIPGLTVDLSRGQVSGASAPGARLDLGIRRQGQALLQRSLAADARGGFQLELPDGLTLRTGDQLELRQLEPAGDTLRLAVPELTVEADRAKNRISGRAAPGGDLTVAAGSALQEDFAISQDWPAIHADGSWRADLVPSWTLAPGSLVQARYRLAAGHLVIRRAVVPLLRAELGGPNACGIGAVRDAVGAELLAADGGRLSKAEGRTDIAGRFRLSFADAAGALLRSAAGQRMRATIAGGTLAVDLPELALSPDWERGSLQGRGPARSTVFLQWPARRCLEGLQRGSGLVGLMATQTDAAGRFGLGLPGPLAAGEGFDVYVPLADGQQVFRQVYRSLLQVFIDSDRVAGSANSAATLRASLGRGGGETATGAATADGDGRFSVHLQGANAAPARIQAGDVLAVDADGQTATVTVPALGFDWSRGEAVAGEAPAGAALTLGLRLADGRRLDLRRTADAAGRWRFAADEVPPRGGWSLDDITAVRATLTVAGGHQVIAQTEGFEAAPRPEPGLGGRRIFLPRVSQPLGRAGQLAGGAALEHQLLEAPAGTTRIGESNPAPVTDDPRWEEIRQDADGRRWLLLPTGSEGG